MEELNEVLIFLISFIAIFSIAIAIVELSKFNLIYSSFITFSSILIENCNCNRSFTFAFPVNVKVDVENSLLQISYDTFNYTRKIPCKVEIHFKGKYFEFKGD